MPCLGCRSRHAQMRKEVDRDRQSVGGADIDQERLLADRPRLRLIDGNDAEGSHGVGRPSHGRRVEQGRNVGAADPTHGQDVADTGLRPRRFRLLGGREPAPGKWPGPVGRRHRGTPLRSSRV